VELPIFLFGVLIVLAFLARNRVYGGRTRRQRDEIEQHRPQNYGATMAPGGTSRAASVNAPWFAREHGQDQPRSHGSE
jgi:hypothetical protein